MFSKLCFIYESFIQICFILPAIYWYLKYLLEFLIDLLEIFYTYFYFCPMRCFKF